ncbi:MAG TPA: hypothetical protein VGI16_11945 [Candidatus Acidoferrum sp.]|jgi:hypothetical protein
MAALAARFVWAIGVASMACALSLAADNLDELQSRFDNEQNSVHKSKLFEKLGNAEMVEIRHASKASDFSRMDLTVEKYRDNARVAEEALKKQHPDAERQSDGYKRLQMHIHRMLRELDDAILVAPEEYRPPLEIVRKDLMAIDDELLRLLFPHRPEVKPPVASPSTSLEVSL